MNTTYKSDKTLLGAGLLFTLGAMLWLGSLLFFGVGVAMIIFKILPTKDLAGTLNAAILHRLNMMELVGAASMGISFVLLWQRAAKRDIMSLVGILCVMLLCWCAYALGITSEMNILRANINSFDAPTEAAKELITRFRGYHVWYSRLVSVNIVFGFGLVVLQMRLLLKMAAKPHE